VLQTWVEKSEAFSCVSDATEKLESSLLALMGVAHLKMDVSFDKVSFML
jgi:hypothetical protein